MARNGGIRELRRSAIGFGWQRWPDLRLDQDIPARSHRATMRPALGRSLSREDVMRFPRFTISGLMALVLLVALDA
jgi:hypothetical protein